MMKRREKLFLRLLAVVLAVDLLMAGSACAGQELREGADNFFANTDPKYAAFIARAEDFSHSNSYHGIPRIMSSSIQRSSDGFISLPPPPLTQALTGWTD